MKIREHGGTSCKLFWTDLREKTERRVRRMWWRGRRSVGSNGKNWEELGWKRKKRY